MRAARDRRMLAAKRPRTGDEHERVVARSQVVARRFRTIFCRSHSNTRCVTHFTKQYQVGGGGSRRPHAKHILHRRPRDASSRGPRSRPARLTAAWSAPSDVRAGTSCKCNGSSGGLARRSTKVEERRTRTAREPPAHRPRTARAPPFPRSAFSITAGGIAGLHRVAVVRNASRV